MSEIPEGTYKGRAVEGSEQYGTTNNGTDQIAIDLEIPELGRRLTTFLYFTDKSAPFSIEKLRACGWIGDDLSRLEGIGANEVEIQVSYEEYNGEPKLKVQIMGGGRITIQNTMSDQRKRAFAASYRALAQATRPVSAPTNSAPRAQPKPKPRTSPPPASESGYDGYPEATSDDIPF